MERRFTPEEKYHLDPQFHQLVDMLENFIVEADFAPSELREAVVLAAINYELKRPRTIRLTEDEYKQWREKEKQRRKTEKGRFLIECVQTGVLKPEEIGE